MDDSLCSFLPQLSNKEWEKGETRIAPRPHSKSFEKCLQFLAAVVSTTCDLLSQPAIFSFDPKSLPSRLLRLIESLVNAEAFLLPETCLSLRLTPNSRGQVMDTCRALPQIHLSYPGPNPKTLMHVNSHQTCTVFPQISKHS